MNEPMLYINGERKPLSYWDDETVKKQLKFLEERFRVMDNYREAKALRNTMSLVKKR